MHRPQRRRPVLSYLAAAAIAVAGLAAFAPSAQAADSDIKINEVESNGGTPGDWIEVINTGSSPVDISGFGVLDNDATHAKVLAPAGTTLAPGAFYVFDTEVSFGLGGADSATLYAADGTTQLDSYNWTAHAASTYGRCPDGTGAFGDTASTRGAPNSCTPPPPTSVKLNELESDGGTPGDWVELKNTGSSPVDISGLKLKDGDDTHAFFTVPAATTLAAGAYYVADVDPIFGLGSADSIRLFAIDGTTVLDSYTWAAHATTSYGRCPDGTGSFITTQVVTRGALNNCPGDIIASPWPGGADVATVDDPALATSNMSGLYYQGTGTGDPGTLWAVRNGGPEALYKLAKSGSSWLPEAGWTAGKQLRYPSGTGQPDAEGVTFTGTPADGVFVSTERDNAANTVSRPAILRFDPNAAGTELTATGDWNLTADLPALGPNLGLEGIAWVPDSYLTARGFLTSGGTPYNPADYPNHGTGLFLVGVEQNGMVYAYALDLTGSGFTRVASFASGFPSVMELSFEQETQQLWVVCDDTCQGRTARFDVDTAAGASQGTFVPVEYYERPSGMANLNNEGFTTAPRSECSGGLKPAFWSDDNDTGGNSLREGTVTCQDREVQPVTFTSTAPVNPTVGQSYTPAATGGASGNAVVISVASSSASVCSIAAGVVAFNQPGSCVVQADQAGDEDFTPGTAQQSITVVARPVPTITATLSSAQPVSAAGWYRTRVKISFTCTPNGSPLVGRCPAAVVLTRSGADQIVTRTITARDGGNATVTVSVDIDLVAPKVSIAGVTAGRTYSAPQQPICVGSDALSGLASCQVSQRQQGDRYVVTAVATDRAGNVKVATLTYRVRP
ncbi:MAG TPA: lamin tail domain-containing protein [Nocardioides sp.]|uniref:lamin tail domain-containing protein n=1 Tax=uncultured Nocardioides sp. TaxID=198441 RepID=UPI000EBD7C32|nr:lamin tail domain-containing protein [uncultured Nocardioides sp.]HCB04290.1 cell wall protein [Nocardioides sp.]HRI94520.1 lamin tail domain-containing protein [Nocardioides sp.]HRK44436.1 lamin tail domain-containing protein [Nocardioides sp.]